jgi:Na+/H+-translocating membrane pyrophosphatase
VAFLVGAFCSAISGYIGMYVSVKSNVRCAAAARRSLNEAITVALRGGAVSGFLIVALSLIGVANYTKALSNMKYQTYYRYRYESVFVGGGIRITY